MNTQSCRVRKAYSSSSFASPQIVAAVVRVPPPVGPPFELIVVVVEVIVGSPPGVEPAVLLPLIGVTLANSARMVQDLDM